MIDPTVRKTPCPLCGSHEATFRPGNSYTHFACDVCGKFSMTFELKAAWEMEGEHHPYLSAATRKASESGRLLILTTENWREREEEQRSIRVSEKVDHLLRLIAEQSGAPGRPLPIKRSIDYPLIAARDGEELQSYLLHLEERGLL